MFRVGKTRIQKVFEMDLNGMMFEQLLPDLDPADLRAHPDWVPAGTGDDEGHALLSIHSWLIHHDGRTILVDTGAGNDKARPDQPILDHLGSPFLERLRQAGVGPGQVDAILHTHIHSDHVGWDTRLEGDRSVPTFPNATVICSGLEWRYGAALADDDADGIAAARRQAGLGEPVRTPVSGTFADSMRPLEPAGKVWLIDVDGSEVLPGIRFIPTPGHSIDHASIEIESDGEVALFGGDVLHHPLEIHDTDLVSCFCEFPGAVGRSRRALLKRAVERRATVFSSHFPLSSAGRIVREGDGYAWNFEKE
ncbi:MBL fold metallo-hydrolase [Sphingomonas bacterium]|uniref:MBL fold metallo-hydrolase n=1 Tax=Sphingomonas bacterium TaxID=1895847 RepID=UPI0015774A36|nr:MBL fold metallo-hydrolase [Sphingomonas bacterium]